MTPAEVRAELDRFVRLGLQQGFVLSGQTPTIYELGQGRRRVAPPKPSAVQRQTLIGRFATVPEYRFLLRTGDFLAALADGSILQASYLFYRDEVISHRLAFFPCPVVFELDDLEAATLDEVVDAALAGSLATIGSDDASTDDLSSLRLTGPWRFDFCREPAPQHPVSHCHVGVSACRIPVNGPLSPGHFFRFVFKNFLPEVWARVGGLRDWPMQDLGETIRHPEESLEVHLSWRRGGRSPDPAVA